jgi:hypothetical protein
MQKNEAFDSYGKPRIVEILDHFDKNGRLSDDVSIEIIQRAKENINKQENLVRLKNGPFIIVGNLNGSFKDLLKILRIEGGSSILKNRYIFLGSYLGDGESNIEVYEIFTLTHT